MNYVDDVGDTWLNIDVDLVSLAHTHTQRRSDWIQIWLEQQRALERTGIKLCRVYSNALYMCN